MEFINDLREISRDDLDFMESGCDDDFYIPRKEELSEVDQLLQYFLENYGDYRVAS